MLLEEAIRFHDYSDAQIKKAGGFQRFEADVLARGLPSVRWQIHDAALDHLTKLLASIRTEITNDQFQALLLETHTPQMAKRTRTLPGEARGRAAVRALISPDFRSPERSRLLTQGRGNVLVRRLEELDSAADALHALVDRAAIEQALTDSFGADITTVWGGSRSVALGGRANDTTQNGGYVTAGRAAVGLTEKLYEQFAAQAFRKAHTMNTLTLREIPPTVAGGPPFHLHVDIRAHVRFIFRELFLGEWKTVNDLPRPLGLWHRNLQALESRFLHACLLGDTAQVAAAVGLPWALVLTGIMRVYLADLMIRLLMVALPTHFSWNGLTGYAGVALWEALVGNDAPHPTRLGYLIPRALADAEFRTTGPPSPTTPQPGQHPLLGVLSTWRTRPFESFVRTWGQTLPHQQRLAPLLLSMADAPTLIARPDPKSKSQPKTTATLEETIGAWPRYPVCRFPGIREREAGSDLRLGAYLTAQAHLFIADQILRVALDDLGLPQPHSKRRDEGDAVDLLVRSGRKRSTAFTPAVGVFAGSLLWGGRHPPHITHRDGATFDLVFGARTVAWLPVARSKQIDEAAREAGLNTKTRRYADLEGVCLNAGQQKARAPAAQIFRSLMREQVRKEFKPLRDALSRRPGNAELALHREAEKRLAGTPHFSSTLAAQQVQIAYSALLLSAPTQVIFSSPIAHLRAMRAIRFGFAGVDGAIVSGAAKALRDATFIFKPQDHHDHWHLQYSIAGGSGANPEPAVKRFASFLPLWERLGIDLQPLITYLEDLEFSPGGDSQTKRTSVERDLLLDELATYTPAKDGRDHLRRLFVRFSRSDPDGLLKSAASTKLSVPLQALAEESQGVIVKLRARQMIDRVLEFLETVDALGLILRGDPTDEPRDVAE